MRQRPTAENNVVTLGGRFSRLRPVAQVSQTTHVLGISSKYFSVKVSPFVRRMCTLAESGGGDGGGGGGVRIGRFVRSPQRKTYNAFV